MVMDSKLCTTDFDLEQLQNDGDEFLVKQVISNQAKNLKLIDWEWENHWHGDLVNPSKQPITILNRVGMCEL